MSIKNLENKRPDGQDKDFISDQREFGNSLHRPEKKLIIGTVQFYEDVLHSLNKSFIIVFSKLFRQIEVWGNSNITDLYGISVHQLKGKLITDCFPAQAGTELKARIKEIFETGKSGSVKVNIPFPTGSFWFEVALSPLVESPNPPSAVIGYFNDISESKKNEKELVVAREKYRNFFELSPEPMLSANLKGVILSVNEALLHTTNGIESDFLGKKITRVPLFKKSEAVRFQQILTTINENRIPPAIEIEMEQTHGESSWFEVRTSIKYKNNHITGFHLIFNDISDRKSIENDLMKSKQAYKVIIENAPEAIYILQGDQIIFCNSRLLDMVACSMDEVLRMPFIRFLHPHDKESFETRQAECHRARFRKSENQFRIIDSRGAVKWIKSNEVMIEWDGSPAMLSFSSDVTAQRQTSDQEKNHLDSLKFLSEKVLEFVGLGSGYNIYRFLGEKITEIQKDSLVLLISYNPETGFSEIEHIEGPGEQCEALSEIINSKSNHLRLKINDSILRNISFGKIIKVNDGLFEQGSSLFPKSTFSLIRQKLGASLIYIIGISWEKTVFGNAMIFLPEKGSLKYPDAIETIVKLGSFALHRNKIEEDLKISEEKYRNIFESYQDVYYRAEIDGTITEVSPSIQKILGYAPSDVPGRLIGDFFAEPAIVKHIGRSLLKEGIISDHDIRLVHKNGSIIDASLNARILVNAEGIPFGSEGVIRDISERKKSDANFYKNEEKFRMLADYTWDWEYWISPDESITYMSPSCERISGYTAQAFIADPELLLKIADPDDRHYFGYSGFGHCSEHPGDDVVTFDFRIITKNREKKWINHVCRKVYGTDGQYLGLRASNRDITDRKEAEQALRDSEERFKTLFYDSPDAVFVEDYDGNVLDANPAACRLHNVEKGKLVGSNIIELIPNYQKDQVATDFTKWITGEYKQCRGISKTSDGLCIPVEIHASKITYSGKNALMFIVRDITVIKETEDKLREAKEKAEEADMLKSVFLANMSHEIRTPMNAIIGFSEILSDQELTKKERLEFINYITQGSNTLMNLIEDIIDITKIEAGQIKINFAECDVNTLMDELYATFLKIKNKNNKQKIELRLVKPVVEPGFAISTDPSRIRQILSNLIGNALKFTEDGYIEIGFSNPEDNKIIFYVKDTGIGIPKDKQEIIFERFGQVEDPSGKERQGTGLGLSISKKLAELLGGALTVESEAGKGSVFYLSLPLRKEQFKIKGKEKHAGIEYADWSDKTFLIAEDSILNYTYLEALFQKTKVKILWAKDGREAINMCRENKNIDLVLMDIKMPVLNGLDAIIEIKKFRKDLPIIVQTAYAMPEDKDKSFAAGGDDHLTKPINAEELFESINKFLN